MMDNPNVVVTYHLKNQTSSSLLATSDLESRAFSIQCSRLMSPARVPGDKSIPHCWLKLVGNCSLTRVGCERDVCHLEFEFHSTEVEYEVGDALEILPSQNPDAVDAFLHRCNLDPEALIMVQRRDITGELDISEMPLRLKSFVDLTMDIASASPRRYLFESLMLLATLRLEL